MTPQRSLSSAQLDKSTPLFGLIGGNLTRSSSMVTILARADDRSSASPHGVELSQRAGEGERRFSHSRTVTRPKPSVAQVTRHRDSGMSVLLYRACVARMFHVAARMHATCYVVSSSS